MESWQHEKQAPHSTKHKAQHRGHQQRNDELAVSERPEGLRIHVSDLYPQEAALACGSRGADGGQAGIALGALSFGAHLHGLAAFRWEAFVQGRRRRTHFRRRAFCCCAFVRGVPGTLGSSGLQRLF